MSPILVRIFAFIGFLFTLFVVLGIGVGFHYSHSTPSEPEKVVLLIDFDRSIVEKSNPSPLDFASHDEPMPLVDVLHAINNARLDAHVKGIVARFGSNQASLAQVQEISGAIDRFRKTGKFAYAFGTSYGDFGNGSRAYLLASHFDKLWLQPVGAVSLTGVAIEAPFGKTALARFGVEGDFMRRQEYKSFDETFTRDNFSEPVRQNMQSMLQSLADQIASGIAKGRGWDAARVKDLISGGPYTASESLKNGLVDNIGHLDELDKKIDGEIGEDADRVGLDDYLGFGDGVQPAPKAHVALIFGTGMIADHGSTTADVTGEDVMGADTVTAAFNDAADDKTIKAIIFRVDSPGGSPEASETIRAALLHAQHLGKPVFVSMGELAASGGYWVSMSADRIFAQPGTITGSIGVLAGKFVVQGLLEKFGVGFQTLSTDPNAGMWSMQHAFTPQQRDRMNAFLDETYKDFTTTVSEARKIPLDQMPNVAKGRVFTGEQALKVGLIDELGGMEETVSAVKKQLKLADTDSISLEEFPAPMTTSERVIHLLKNFGFDSAMVRSALLQWQSVHAALGPVFDAGQEGHISLQAPEAVRSIK